MPWTLRYLMLVVLLVMLSGSVFEHPVQLVDAHQSRRARQRVRRRRYYRNLRRQIPSDPKLDNKANLDSFNKDVEDAVDNDDDEDDQMVNDEGSPPIPDMSMSYLLPITDSMSCMKDVDDTYCLLKDINPIPTIQITKLSDLNSVTTEMLDDYCIMAQYPRCSRLLQALVVEADSPTSKTLPRYAACARHSDGTYCIDAFRSISTLPEFERCWIQVAAGVCSPTCSISFRGMLETLGCCARSATVLLGQMGRTDALHALRICPGLDQVSVALDQSCGGLSKLGPSKVAQEISLTLDFPCEILDFAESTLEDLFESELADFVDVEKQHISAVRMSCSSKPISSPMTYTENSHLNLRRGKNTVSHATHVTFRITAGLFSDEVASTLMTKLKKQGASFFMKELTAAIRALLIDAPIVGLIGAPVSSTNNAVMTLGHASCDPMKFLDVIEKCWDKLQEYMNDSEDSDIEWDERTMCDAASPCARALDRLGVQNLSSCKPSLATGGILGLAYLSVMCVRNEKGVPCARYLRDDDETLACSLMTREICDLESGCIWDVTFNRCAAPPNRAFLDGFCGICHSKIVDVSSMLAPMNNEIPPLAGSTLTSMCMRSNSAYCVDVFATNAHLLESKDTSRNVAKDFRSTPTESKSSDIVLSSEICGVDDKARCQRMSLIMSAQRSRIAAESCTLHPLLCLTKVEYAMKQDVLVETMLELGCEKETSGKKICAERIQSISPDVLACYDLILEQDTCTVSCGELWKKEIDNLGCCTSLAHAYLESIDEDQTPMDRRGLHRLKGCIPNIDETIRDNPSCPPATSTPVVKTLRFGLDCLLFNEELRLIFVEKVPDDMSVAAGIANKFITVQDVSCSSGNGDQSADYGMSSNAKIINSPTTSTGVVVVTYEVNTRTQEETDAAAIAIDAFVQGQGELMWLEVAISNALGQAFDLNHK